MYASEIHWNLRCRGEFQFWLLSVVFYVLSFWAAKAVPDDEGALQSAGRPESREPHIVSSRNSFSIIQGFLIYFKV